MKFKFTPWQHQQEIFEAFTNKRELAMFMEMGTGKTPLTIMFLEYLFACDRSVLSTFILCPKIVMTQWKREIEKFSNIPTERVVILDGTGTKRLKLAAKGIEKYNGECILICNYEALPRMDELVKLILKWSPEILICDESHKVKSRTAKVTKIVTKISDKTRYRYLLTGTPATNSPEDLWSQFRILDGGQTFGMSFVSFRNKYFYDKNAPFKARRTYFPNWTIQPTALERMRKKLEDKSVRVLKVDCLDLPPRVYQRVEVDLSPAQKKHYEEMKNNFITFVEASAIEKHKTGREVLASVATLALTKVIRMEQIVTGFLKTEEEVICQLDKTPRYMALKELLGSLTPEHKVIVWAVFKENYEQIRKCCDELKIKYAEVHGEIKDKQPEIDRFNDDEDCRVMIGNPSAGGVGVNLVSASYSIYFSRDFNLTNDLQSQDRNYRGGSEIHEKITRIDIVTPGTIDEHIIDKLMEKKETSDELLGDTKREDSIEILQNLFDSIQQ